MQEELKVKIYYQQDGMETFTVSLVFVEDTVIKTGDAIKILHDFYSTVPQVQAFLYRKEEKVD